MQKRGIMAYQGYLIKVGNYTIPLKYIAAESYQVTNYGQDLDSYQDTDGVLHRTALVFQAPKVEFETRNMLDHNEMWDLISHIRANFTDTVEKKASVTVFIPELNEYITNDMYMADFSPTMYLASSKEIKYNSTRIAFISYGVVTNV